jgi:HAE1 family hydrophobic/amphiphilic exporter-1
VGRAVVASTLTTICVFLPIVFVEGVAGQLFGDQAMTVTFSLLISLIVALTVIPMLASRKFDFEQAHEPPHAPGWRGKVGRVLGGAAFRLFVVIGKVLRWLLVGLDKVVRLVLALPLRAFEGVYKGIEASYERTLARVLEQPLSVVLVTMALLAGSLMLVPGLGRELVPELIQGEFFVDAELPPGTHLDVTQARIAVLEKAAMDLQRAQTVYAIVGTSNEQGGVSGELRENLGQLTVTLISPYTRQDEETMMASLRGTLDVQDDLDYRFGRPSYFSFKTPVEVELRGFNLTLLERVAEQITSGMREIPGLVDVKSSTEGGYPELQIHFRRDRLANLGLSLADVATTVRSKIQGTVATDIQREDRTIDIRLRAEEEYRDSVRDLRELPVSQSGKVSIQLGAVADIVEVEGPAEIRRSEGERVASISANLDGRDLASVSADIEDLMSGIALPPGFDWQMGGQQKEMETSFDSMRMAILLAIFMVYLVMASQFESLLHPLVILFSVPFSLIGVVLVLWVFKVPISIVVMIGVILLIGIVVNNAIILVDYTNRLRRDGLAKLDALRKAGQVRLRPILMTTATTVLGLTPMALGLGEGSELRTPMALTVIGGLLTSTALTLLIIPAVYSIVDRRP